MVQYHNMLQDQLKCDLGSVSQNKLLSNLFSEEVRELVAGSQDNQFVDLHHFIFCHIHHRLRGFNVLCKLGNSCLDLEIEDTKYFTDKELCTDRE